MLVTVFWVSLYT